MYFLMFTWKHFVFYKYINGEWAQLKLCLTSFEKALQKIMFITIWNFEEDRKKVTIKNNFNLGGERGPDPAM